jgi:hypothetical protein
MHLDIQQEDRELELILEEKVRKKQWGLKVRRKVKMSIRIRSWLGISALTLAMVGSRVYTSLPGKVAYPGNFNGVINGEKIDLRRLTRKFTGYDNSEFRIFHDYGHDGDLNYHSKTLEDSSSPPKINIAESELRYDIEHRKRNGLFPKSFTGIFHFIKSLFDTSITFTDQRNYNDYLIKIAEAKRK